MNRRSFTAGLMSLACAGPSLAGALAVSEVPSEIEMMAECLEIFARLDDDEKAVHLELLRGLVALRDGDCSDQLFAEADRQLQALRGRVS